MTVRRVGGGTSRVTITIRRAAEIKKINKYIIHCKVYYAVINAHTLNYSYISLVNYYGDYRKKMTTAEPLIMYTLR